MVTSMSQSKTMIAENAVIASEQPLATMAGYDVLRRGGNAFDAAVAISFALAVTFHPAGGLGGDFFGMFYKSRTGEVLCLNSSGWAPSGLTLELTSKKGSRGVPQFGPMSCVIPGLVAGVWEMHRVLGSMDFAELLKPSESFASDGFPAGPALCRSVANAFPELSNGARSVFAPGGRKPIPGEKIK